MTPERYNNGLLFVCFKEQLAATARLCRMNAKSYRNFRVGCVILATNGRDVEVFFGWNLKQIEWDPKFCAEMMALQSLRQAGFTEIIAVVVCGFPQVEKGSGQQWPTLHPCDVCRLMLLNAPEITDHTIFYTVHPSGESLDEQFASNELSLIHV